jgi:hypothetical protein
MGKTDGWYRHSDTTERALAWVRLLNKEQATPIQAADGVLEALLVLLTAEMEQRAQIPRKQLLVALAATGHALASLARAYVDLSRNGGARKEAGPVFIRFIDLSRFF